MSSSYSIYAISHQQSCHFLNTSPHLSHRSIRYVTRFHPSVVLRLVLSLIFYLLYELTTRSGSFTTLLTNVSILEPPFPSLIGSIILSNWHILSKIMNPLFKRLSRRITVKAHSMQLSATYATSLSTIIITGTWTDPIEDRYGRRWMRLISLLKM